MAGDRWLSKTNIIALISAGVGLLAAMFGVAAANPAGQRVLCGLHPFFCDDVTPLQPVASVDAVDFDAWCRARIGELEALPEFERPPGVGPYPSAADCVGDLGAPEFGKFTRPLTSLRAGERAYLTANLTFQHARVRTPTAFTVRTLCGHAAPGAGSWTAIACKLDPNLQIGDWPPVAIGARPPEAVQAELTPDQLYFSQTWRLALADQASTETLAPGAYQVNLHVAEDAESVGQVSVRFEFSVE